VQTIPDAQETPELRALASADDRMTAVVGRVERTAPDVTDRLAAMKSRPRGVTSSQGYATRCRTSPTRSGSAVQMSARA
jgi:hypothetical protein